MGGLELTCKQCGTPSGVMRRAGSSMTVLCDDVCVGAWWDRVAGGHFVDGTTELCGKRYLLGKEHPLGDLVLCDLHQRLALAEIDWRRREGHPLYGHLDPPGAPAPDPWDGVA